MPVINADTKELDALWNIVEVARGIVEVSSAQYLEKLTKALYELKVASEGGE